MYKIYKVYYLSWATDGNFLNPGEKVKTVILADGLKLDELKKALPQDAEIQKILKIADDAAVINFETV